jgi:hypothetical protein
MPGAQAAGRLTDLPLRWNGCRVLVIGHVATSWGLDHSINGVRLENPCPGGLRLAGRLGVPNQLIKRRLPGRPGEDRAVG